MCVNIIYECICLYCVICLILYYRSLLICTNKEFMNCCSFYGSPLWHLNGAAVQSLCIDWRKSLRSLWGVHPTTHCNVSTALSNEIPLICTLQNRFIRFMSKCLSSSNLF